MGKNKLYIFNSGDAIRENISLDITAVIDYIDLITEIEGRMGRNLTGEFRNKHQDPRLNVLMANGINRNSSAPHTSALEVSKTYSRVAEILADESYNYYKNMVKEEHVGMLNDANLMLLSLMTNSVTIANAIISIASNIITGSELDKVNQAIGEMKLDIETYSKALIDITGGYSEEALLLKMDSKASLSNLITYENIDAISGAYLEIRKLYLTSNNAIFIADYEKEDSIVKKIVEEVVEPSVSMLNKLSSFVYK